MTIEQKASKLYTDYWNGKIDGRGLQKGIVELANQQISKVVSEIEEKCEKYDWRAADGPYVHGYDDAIDQVHKVLEEYKK